jgi:3-oxoacyl-[acyl-carrier protein] reductase
VGYRASAAEAEEVVEAIRAAGGEAEAIEGDVGTTAAATRLAEEARERLGTIDVWVNNAGADVLTGEAADWDWERKLDVLLAVDLKGTVACSRAVGEMMRAQPEGGTILNMAWDHVTHGMAGENQLLFSAVKGGVLSYSKSLARALAPEVRVNVLSPGFIETAFGSGADRSFYREVEELTPLGRWGRPEDVAAAAVYLASPEAGFVTGQAVNINGGVI